MNTDEFSSNRAALLQRKFVILPYILMETCVFLNSCSQSSTNEGILFLYILLLLNIRHDKLTIKGRIY